MTSLYSGCLSNTCTGPILNVGCPNKFPHGSGNADSSHVGACQLLHRRRRCIVGRCEIAKTDNYSALTNAALRLGAEGGPCERRREKRETRGGERNEGGGEGEGRTRRRSDGVINDRVFNTLYGLAYKLRAVHRSSWQRINGRGAEHEADLSLFLLPSLSISLVLYFFRLRNRSLSLSFSQHRLVRAGLLFRGSLPSLPFIHPFSRMSLTDVVRMRTGR